MRIPSTELNYWFLRSIELCYDLNVKELGVNLTKFASRLPRSYSVLKYHKEKIWSSAKFIYLTNLSFLFLQKLGGYKKFSQNIPGYDHNLFLVFGAD